MGQFDLRYSDFRGVLVLKEVQMLVLFDLRVTDRMFARLIDMRKTTTRTEVHTNGQRPRPSVELGLAHLPRRHHPTIRLERSLELHRK
jgi:hypothetical protein